MILSNFGFRLLLKKNRILPLCGFVLDHLMRFFTLSNSFNFKQDSHWHWKNWKNWRRFFFQSGNFCQKVREKSLNFLSVIKNLDKHMESIKKKVVCTHTSVSNQLRKKGHLSKTICTAFRVLRAELQLERTQKRSENSLWSLSLVYATQCKHTTCKSVLPFQAISLSLSRSLQCNSTIKTILCVCFRILPLR